MGEKMFSVNIFSYIYFLIFVVYYFFFLILILVFASGPWSYLFSGIHEQNYIPHAIGWAACLKDYCSDGNSLAASLILLFFVVILSLFNN